MGIPLAVCAAGAGHTPGSSTSRRRRAWPTLLAAAVLLVAVAATARADCGDGSLDEGEQCDEGGANGSSTSCCTASCELRPPGDVCRPAVDVCDVADECDGLGGTCPANAVQPDGTPCPDATVCNGAETCAGGACAPGSPLDCDDQNVCTADSCDPVLGCQHDDVTDGTPCPDGTVCDGAETCLGGFCSPGSALDCDDGNPCTADSCDPIDGCQHTQVANDTPCPDGNVCNGDEVCGGGTCGPGTPLACDDGDPCTIDSCHAVLGCQHASVTDGTPCPDGTVCNGAETCQGGTCSPGTPPDCDDGNLCTSDSCNPTLGCQHASVTNGMPCHDGTVCNGAETCQGGTCSAGSPLDCNDGNPCTADSCDPVLGCQHPSVINGTPCPDGTVCNGAESCQGGTCTPGSPPDCDDGNVCTTDSCDAVLGCQHANATNGTPCPDGTLCNGGETCQGGSCSPGTAPDCNDGNSCTVDSCDAVLGCGHTFTPGCQPCSVDADCSDHDVCDGAEHCQGGTCAAGTPLSCNDGNVCTTDSCNPTLGCQHTNVTDGTACPDGNRCNGANTCASGVCMPGTPPNCNDGNPCTSDSCNPPTGCVHTNVTDGTPCLDGTVCDGAESCQGGTCTAGSALDCNDNNPCTADSCDPVTGCGHTSVIDGTSCSDSNPCNGTERCVSGACTSGPLPNCGDANPCTTDTCVPLVGCTHTSVGNGTPCVDGTVCDGTETCQNGFCATGTSLDCDDGEGCTADACDPVSGCSHTPVPGCQPCEEDADCNDGLPCTRDRCVDRACTFTPDTDLCPNHFLCYKAKVTPTTTKFSPVLGVSLVDAFETRSFDLSAIKHLCTPANNGNGIVDPVTHLVSYKLKLPITQLPHTPRTRVKMTNVLGTLRFDTIKPELLLVVSAKSLVSSPPAPAPEDNDVDDYKCYKAKVSPGTPTFSHNVVISLSDQFISPPKALSVKAPKHICLPVSRDGAPLKNPDRDYVCYKVKPALGQPLFVRRTAIHVNNAIHASTLDITKEDEVCIPSLRDLPGCTLNVDCNDGNPCTVDVCSGGDCQHSNATAGSPCPDGNACNGAESCQSGVCTSGSAPSCNDGNPCTLDTCLPSTGCSNLPLSNGTGCGSGMTCTGGVCG